MVDDNAFNSQVLSMMIKNIFDIEVDVVFDGFSAIDLAKKKLTHPCCNYYRVIFMDINMPEIDGFETTKRITKMIEEDYLTKNPVRSLESWSMVSS